MRFAGILLFLCTSAWAGEYALLASGSRLHIERHETEGSKVRLYVAGGFAVMSADEVRGFEADDYAPPAPPPVPVSKPAAISESATVPAKAAVSPEELADQAADRYGLPRWLVRAVMSAESAFQPHAVSPKGAIGLMQLMPGTAQLLGADATDPAQNADAGARYLRDLLVKYDGALWHALAAYNAGPGAVDKYHGPPPYAETIRYINRINRDRKKAARELQLSETQIAQRP